jgi:hypothetical protein
MLFVTQHAALQAAFVSNLLYGLMLVLPARARATLAAGDMPFVLGAGAIGHLLHAVTVPEREPGRIADICLMFASLWVFTVSLPTMLSVGTVLARALLGG